MEEEGGVFPDEFLDGLMLVGDGVSVLVEAGWGDKRLGRGLVGAGVTPQIKLSTLGSVFLWVEQLLGDISALAVLFLEVERGGGWFGRGEILQRNVAGCAAEFGGRLKGAGRRRKMQPAMGNSQPAGKGE